MYTHINTSMCIMFINLEMYAVQHESRLCFFCHVCCKEDDSSALPENIMLLTKKWENWALKSLHVWNNCHLEILLLDIHHDLEERKNNLSEPQVLSIQQRVCEKHRSGEECIECFHIFGTPAICKLLVSLTYVPNAIFQDQNPCLHVHFQPSKQIQISWAGDGVKDSVEQKH